ncbi:MAG: phosphoribosylformylglycinamidine cyclo-ligase, partial [Firmicutes bacterium]|nr:phosphoribosylformylglycinamidine cyclo-ligase [Bacillota bacterium]
ERESIVDVSTIEPGDALSALASRGLHSNGFSLVRKLILEVGGHKLSDRVPQLGEATLESILLTPTRIYVPSVLKLLSQFTIRGMAHITGGGLTENIPRMLPSGCGAAIELDSWRVPPIFRYLEQLGNLAPEESYRTFNMGVGFVLVVPQEEAATCIAAAQALGEQAWLLGEVVAGEGVVYRGR